MAYTTFKHFLLMGGYGGYVWSVYGTFVLVFCVNIAMAVSQKKRLIALINNAPNKPNETQAPKHIQVIEDI